VRSQAVLLPLRFPSLCIGLRSGASTMLLYGAPGELLACQHHGNDRAETLG